MATQSETNNAVQSLRKGEGFSCTPEGVVTMLDGSNPPTNTEIEAEVTRIKHKEVRRYKYPDISDQLDSLYRAILAGKVDATGEFAKAIKAVKDANPKS